MGAVANKRLSGCLPVYAAAVSLWGTALQQTAVQPPQSARLPSPVRVAGGCTGGPDGASQPARAEVDIRRRRLSRALLACICVAGPSRASRGAHARQ
ncbi:unnamed protein product [Schistocephalus solidus]|uniref:Secreted protein n=1 Tax=Schistocephalus solidus TaxID=70667 RepID=A0A183TKG2_SCHSO|nr:unnamed protein product [Schistocephalus solidus]